MGQDVFDALTINKADGSYQRAEQTFLFSASSGKVGTGAGYVVTGLDTGMVTMPPSTGASTFTIPIHGLKVGDVITSFAINGQMESGGLANVLDADLRTMTPATGGSADASIGAITQISKTADYLVADSKTGLTHKVLKGNSYYVLVTGTTLAACDQEILNVTVTVNQR